MLCLLFIIGRYICFFGTEEYKSVWKVPEQEAKQQYVRNLTGTVEKRENGTNSQRLYLRPDPGQEQKGRLMIYDKSFQAIAIGSRIKVSGEQFYFQTPRNPGEFHQQFYYQKEQIFSYVQAEKLKVDSACVKEMPARMRYQLEEFLVRFRSNWAEKILAYAGQEKGGMLCAILMGEKQEVNSDIKELYQMCGIGHILAISGLHISFLGISVYEMMRKRGISFLVSGVTGSILLILYVLLSGSSVSSMRALIMYLIRMGAQIGGRVYDMATALLLAAALILWKKPLYVLDAGFLLSFGAVAVIIWALPCLEESGATRQRRRQRRRERLDRLQEQTEKKHRSRMMQKEICLLGMKAADLARDGMRVSIAVNLFTTPLLLLFYYEIPLYSVGMNVLVVPLMPLLMGCGIAGSILPVASGIVLSIPVLFLSFFEMLCRWCLTLPAARIVLGKPTPCQVIGYYFAVGAIILLLWRYRKAHEDCLPKARWLVGMLLVVCMATAGMKVYTPKDRVFITMIDVGQGDSFLIRGPTGMTYLIDGGSTTEENVARYQMEPCLKSSGVDVIDYVFVTHADEDHISGIRQMFERGNVSIKMKHLVCPTRKVWEEELIKLAYEAKEAGVKVLEMKPGDVLMEGAEPDSMFSLTCLYPGPGGTSAPGNESSLVLSLEYKELQMLFTGDLEKEGEKAFLKDQGTYLKEAGPYDVLKVGHHGSNYATSGELLELVQPKLALISAGKNNRYGHPGKELIERLEKAGIPYYCTKETGAVQMESDGRKIHLYGQRELMLE